MIGLLKIFFNKVKLYIYLALVIIIFGGGLYIGYNIGKCKEVTDKPFKQEEKLIEDNKKTEVIYQDRIKEVIKYVEKTNNTECFTSDDIRVFNND